MDTFGLFLRIRGAQFEDIEFLHGDMEGGFVAHALDSNGRLLRIDYTPSRYTKGTWTTRPEYVEETIRISVVAA